MNLLKKFISVLMTVIIIISSFSVFAFAEEAERKKEEEENEIVATVYVCQKARLHYMSGHTWLYFKNLTNHSITVGIYEVPKGQAVSVGTFGFSIKDGRGLYYNVEGFRYNHPKTDDFVCLKKNLTVKQLRTMSSTITRSGVWSYLLNCSFSAFMIWDSVIGKFLPYLILPPLARLCILMYPQHEKGFILYSPKMDQIFKQKGMGKKAYLVPADPSSK